GRAAGERHGLRAGPAADVGDAGAGAKAADVAQGAFRLVVSARPLAWGVFVKLDDQLQSVNRHGLSAPSRLPAAGQTPFSSSICRSRSSLTVSISPGCSRLINVTA